MRFPPSGSRALLLAGCTVGPDFKRPRRPLLTGYTPEPLPAQTVRRRAPGRGAAFRAGSDIPGEWWTLFHSQPLND